MPENEGQYWFNLSTRQVEQGRQSPGADRAGPFATAEEAARAPELLTQRSQSWQEDDEREDDWDATRSEGAPRQ